MFDSAHTRARNRPILWCADVVRVATGSTINTEKTIIPTLSYLGRPARGSAKALALDAKVPESLTLQILVVDDSQQDAQLLLEALQRSGTEAWHRRVQSGEELLTALASEHWHAVISEFMLPGLSGLEVLATVRAAGLDIPIILLSGTAGEEIAVDAMKAGASDYIMKDSLARVAPALHRALRETQMRGAHRRSSRELVESEERFRSLIALSSDWFWEQDENFRFTQVSSSLPEICAEPFKSWLGKTRWELPYHDADWSEHRAVLKARRPFHDLQLQPFTQDGSTLYVSISGEPKFAADGRFLGYRGVGRDITERKQAEDKLKRLNRLYAMVSSISALVARAHDRDQLLRDACQIALQHGEFEKAWIGMVDRKQNILVPVASAGLDQADMAAIKALFASSKGALQGNTLSARAISTKVAMISNDLHNDEQVVFGKRYAASGIHSLGVVPLIVWDSAVGVLALHTSKREFFDQQGLKLLTDLSDNIASAIDYIDKQQRLDYLVHYDALTGLANRRLFLEHLGQYLLAAATGQHKLALFLIDLERFKSINDSLGRPAGDSLLRQVAQWLVQRAADARLVARVGADQFAVVLPQVYAGGDVTELLETTIADFLNHPFSLNDVVYRIAAKIGAVLYPDDGVDADALFKHAEAALKKTKLSGDRYLFYAQIMSETLTGRLGLENQLRQALEHQEFVLHYQPKFDLISSRLTGAEALIRWNRPETGLVQPGRFIPILEQTGLIHEVGRWALRKAIGEYLRWRGMGLAAVPIAVNVSPLQLRHRGFVAEIAQAINIAAHAAAGLELEITESLIMEDVNHSIASLQAIRAMGIRIAIDDFGTGFSSLSYLSKLPIDTLKIDRSFVLDMAGRADGATLVSVIINLAHALKLKAVAEGVEAEEQLRQLRSLECDEMQGFLCGKPVPAEVFESRYLVAASAH